MAKLYVDKIDKQVVIQVSVDDKLTETLWLYRSGGYNHADFCEVMGCLKREYHPEEIIKGQLFNREYVINHI